uniref:Uncharacterized protein n=1 Tax=Pundamilia nyererei TaxID=303518 RepID=A0A3B4H8J7_9CICH
DNHKRHYAQQAVITQKVNSMYKGMCVCTFAGFILFFTSFDFHLLLPKSFSCHPCHLSLFLPHLPGVFVFFFQGETEREREKDREGDRKGREDGKQSRLQLAGSTLCPVDSL